MPVRSKAAAKPLLVSALGAWAGEDEEPSAPTMYVPPPTPMRKNVKQLFSREQTLAEAAEVLQDKAAGHDYCKLFEEANRPAEQRALGTPPPPGPPPGPASMLKDALDVERPTFNMAVGVVVLLNAIVIGLETDLGISNFMILEHLFMVLFLAEMLLRVHSQGFRRYLQDPWHIFDCVLLTIGILDLWVCPLVTWGSTSSTGLSNLTALRLLRMLRLLRVLRIVRLLRMFSTLFLLTRAMVKALQVVMSLSTLVAVIDYVLAIFLTQIVGQRAADWGDNEQKITGWFGSIAASMRTLFVMMTLDDWSEVVGTLCEVLPTYFVVPFFISYIIFASYTLVSLVTAVLCASLMLAQQEGKEQHDARVEDIRKAVGNELREQIDELFDEQPCVQASELKTSFKGDRVLLARLGDAQVDIDEDGLLAVIDEVAEDGVVSVEYFVEKLVNLTGPAKASAIVDLKHQAICGQEDFSGLTERVANLEKKLDLLLGQEMDRLHSKLDALSTKGGRSF